MDQHTGDRIAQAVLRPAAATLSYLLRQESHNTSQETFQSEGATIKITCQVIQRPPRDPQVHLLEQRYWGQP